MNFAMNHGRAGQADTEYGLILMRHTIGAAMPS